MTNELKLPKLSKGDVAHAVARSVLSIIPWVGGPAVELFNAIIAPPLEQRRDEWREEVGAALIRLEQEKGVNLEALRDNQVFIDTVLQATQIALRNSRQEKRRALRNAVLNAALPAGDPEKLSYTELDHFVRCLDTLSVGAIEVLGQALAIARHEKFPNLGTQYFRFNFDYLQKRLAETEPSLLLGLVGELNAVNLIHLAGIPAARTENYGNYPLELTPLGVKFAVRLVEM
jgi:hypothetical protein